MKLDLAGAQTWDEIVTLVAAAVKSAEPGDWILGRGWHQEKWSRPPEQQVEGYPVHTKLSAVSPDNPVYLTHASGHAIVANARAMYLAGITQSIPDPEGGKILRFPDGSPTGTFLENAGDLITGRYETDFAHKSPEEQERYDEKAFDLAVGTCLENGITTIHDAGVSFGTVDFYKKMMAAGRLPLRLYVMLGASNKLLDEKMARYRMIGAGDNHLTVRAVKRFIDGALGSHGAWLLEPYSDLPDSYGMNTIDLADLEKTAQLVEKNGFQLCTHAIGERGVSETLNIYEPFTENQDLRWRIEHAQHIDPADLPRFAVAHVIASMQTNHATSDGPWVLKRLGEKRSREDSYVWRKLLDSGVVICNGTDAPVENINPMRNLYSAVTRRMDDGQTFYPEQAMTRAEALKSYTLSGAYAAFEETIKGSVTPGKLADLTILSDDLLTVPESEIPLIRILATMIDGRFVYRASGKAE
jgi:predicted amidohydrolase YtcJ